VKMRRYEEERKREKLCEVVQMCRCEDVRI